MIENAAITNATYENVISVCPHCGAQNTHNRASDLDDFHPIVGREVKCLNPACGRAVHIYGDTINPAHEMLLFDCEDFLRQKRYMHCILSAAQAYEVLFSHYLHVQLLYRPFAKERPDDSQKINELSELLWKKTGKFTFEPLRRLFLQLAIAGTAPHTFAAAEAIILTIPKKPLQVPVSDIHALSDSKLSSILLRLQSATANQVRNKVVHKDAYRPTFQEARDTSKEAWEILSALTSHYRLKGDVNWYINGADR